MKGVRMFRKLKKSKLVVEKGKVRRIRGVCRSRKVEVCLEMVESE